MEFLKCLKIFLLQDIPITEKLSRACEIAAFSPSKRTVYNKFMMTVIDIFNQLHYAKKDGFAEGLAEGEKLEIK